MSYIDLGIVLLIIYAVYRGMKRGMEDEMIGFSGWILALLFASITTAPIGRLIAAKVPSLQPMSIVFALIIAIVLGRIVVFLLLRLFRAMVDPKIQPKYNQYIGGFLGFLKSAFFVGVLAITLVILPLSDQVTRIRKQSSLLYHMQKFSVMIVQGVVSISPTVRVTFQELMQRKGAYPAQQKNRGNSNPLTPEEKSKIIERETQRNQNNGQSPRR